VCIVYFQVVFHFQNDDELDKYQHTNVYFLLCYETSMFADNKTTQPTRTSFNFFRRLQTKLSTCNVMLSCWCIIQSISELFSISDHCSWSTCKYLRWVTSWLFRATWYSDSEPWNLQRIWINWPERLRALPPGGRFVRFFFGTNEKVLRIAWKLVEKYFNFFYPPSQTCAAKNFR
jgi:hypothetical protein